MRNSAAYKREWRKRRLLVDPDYRNREARAWRARHPEVSKAIRQRHREGNLERIREADKLAKRRRRENPDVRRLHRERQKITYDTRMVELAGRPKPEVCELCGGPPQGGFGRELVFDHCHQRGVFRGWLCDRCNRTLGQVKDSPALLRAMADYLEKAHGATESSATEGPPSVSICGTGTLIPCE
jgi:hypothetical protein